MKKKLRILGNVALFIPNVLILTVIGVGSCFPMIRKEPLAFLGLYSFGGIVTVICAISLWWTITNCPIYIFIPALILCPLIVITGIILFIVILHIGIAPHKFGIWWIDEDGKLVRVKND
jgi:uncharacterized membrane protein